MRQEEARDTNRPKVTSANLQVRQALNRLNNAPPEKLPSLKAAFEACVACCDVELSKTESAENAKRLRESLVQSINIMDRASMDRDRFTAFTSMHDLTSPTVRSCIDATWVQEEAEEASDRKKLVAALAQEEASDTKKRKLNE